MNLNEYQKLAMRTSPDGHDRIKNGCMGLICKLRLRYPDGFDPEKSMRREREPLPWEEA
jgi:hypothetical protein